ncbi:hypothetical protein SteCoe_25200 [Stentor coeruleus]|uniref:Uncharacterized protein n=1 Tax=Stentor coeruleus TaxID=5963 RepID=A0A1R2BFZ8_9CILI|nr:hypothetical protein SteCoe_25200 [Stentor coeruleus]
MFLRLPYTLPKFQLKRFITFQSFEAEEWQSKLQSLNNLSYYTDKKLPNLIRNYYHIHAGARLSGVNTIWSSDKTIIDSLNRLSRYVTKLDKDNTVLLARNLSLMGIKNHEIWKIIETHIVKSTISECIPNDIIALVQSLSSIERDEPKVWTEIENFLMKNFYPTMRFDSSRCSNLLLGFKTVNQGTPELIQHIINNLCDKAFEFKSRDIGKIFKALTYEENFPKELLNKICQRISEVKENLLEYDLQRTLGGLVRYGANDKAIFEMEEHALENMKTLSLYHISVIAFTYAKYKEKEIQIKGDRQNFMKSMELYFTKHNARILSTTTGISKDVQELRLMWAFSKTRDFSNLPLWGNYSKNFQNIQYLSGESQFYVEDLEISMKNAGLL